MPNILYDAIIVGLGPAGATVARDLQKAGLSVLALDKQTHPRYKVCGGALSARIDAVLEPDFHALVEQTINTVRFSYGNQRTFEVHSPKPIVYLTMRDTFDSYLVQKAAEAGTTIHQNEKVIDCRTFSEGVEVVTDQSRYRGKVLVGADGANSLIAKKCFPPRRLKRVPALEAEIPLGNSQQYPGNQTLLIDFGGTSKGYGWAFPKQERLSIGVAEFFGKSAKPKEALTRFLRDDQTLSQLHVPPPLGHPIPVFSSTSWTGPACRPGSLVSERTLLVGDAGHLVDPLFGEGIYFGVYSARLAATAIMNYLSHSSASLNEYETLVDHAFGRDLRMAARLVRPVYAIPSLCQRLVGDPFPKPFQELLSLYCRILQGTETYQSLIGQAKNLITYSMAGMGLKRPTTQTPL